MQHPLPFPAGSAALRGVGAAVRTAQIIGIEWFDYAKHSYDEASCATERLAGARTPAEVWAIQGAYLRAAADQFTARSSVFGDLFATLAADLVRAPAGAGPRPTA